MRPAPSAMSRGSDLAALALGALACAACADAPASDRADSLVVEEIDRTIEITAPLPARVYVAYRAVSYAGRVVEYGVELAGRPLVVTYGIDPTAPLPLQTKVFDAATGAPLIALLADDRQLDVYVGDAPAPIHVDRYTLPTALPSGAVIAIDPMLRPLLDAVLPARTEIAPVPAFWRNLDQRPPPGGDIGSSSSAGRPVLPSWSAPVSLLGALFVQGPCVRDDRYACPCMTVDLPAVGQFETCSAAPPVEPTVDRAR